MSYSDIDIYLSAHGVNCKGVQPSTNSKWVYVKELLANADESLLITIANDLGMDHNYSISTPREATFWKAGHFKLFLSHLASFKVTTARLQQALKKYAISSFVAHEDIEPTREWQTEIESALHTMDALAAILMPGFKESNWCDQEVGVAVGRDVLIIPIRRGLDPYGFIGKYQGIQATNKNIGEVADEVFQTVIKSPKTRAKAIRAVANAAASCTDAREAEEKIDILQSIEDIPSEILESLKSSVEENTVLINSELFIKKINVLFGRHSIERIVFGKIAGASKWDDDIPF